jgi:hypothetical protein
MVLPSSLSNWLLEGTDPSVRHRVLRELLDRPDNDPDVVAAREEIGVKGWAADLLALQHPDGHWVTPSSAPSDMEQPLYISTRYFLLVLTDLGVTSADPRMARGVDLYLNRMTGPDFEELGGKDSEACFTSFDVKLGNLFGHADEPRIRRSIDWLVSAQKKDGGWNCQPSEAGTLDTWEPLEVFATIPERGRTPQVREAIERGLEFYLSRGLMNEGVPTYAPWLRLHYPRHYFYDVLVGLDTVTALGKGGDPRLRQAWEWLERKRDREGKWTLEALHPDREDEEYLQDFREPIFPFGLELPGRPSRWITTQALAVLHRAGRV